MTAEACHYDPGRSKIDLENLEWGHFDIDAGGRTLNIPRKM